MSLSDSEEASSTSTNLYVLMALFEEFAHFCHCNNIDFWIDWGTELGSFRHQNIIPWDIDIDTCVLKPSYDKLMSIFEKTIGRLVIWHLIWNLIKTKKDAVGYMERNMGWNWVLI